MAGLQKMLPAESIEKKPNSIRYSADTRIRNLGHEVTEVYRIDTGMSFPNQRYGISIQLIKQGDRVFLQKDFGMSIVAYEFHPENKNWSDEKKKLFAELVEYHDVAVDLETWIVSVEVKYHEHICNHFCRFYSNLMAFLLVLPWLEDL